MCQMAEIWGRRGREAPLAPSGGAGPWGRIPSRLHMSLEGKQGPGEAGAGEKPLEN